MSFKFQMCRWMDGYAEVESTGEQTGLGRNYGFSFSYIEFEMPMDI